MYLDNLKNPIKFQGHRSTVKVTWFYLDVFCVWSCGYPRTVLSLDQGLMMLFL